jgi:hypothetical protein
MDVPSLAEPEQPSIEHDTIIAGAWSLMGVVCESSLGSDLLIDFIEVLS